LTILKIGSKFSAVEQEQSPKFRVKLLLSYEGTNYEGWQRQSKGQQTVQGAVEEALLRIFRKKIDVTGSSRTDSGVHAWGQVAHFDSPRDPTVFKDFAFAVQSALPRNIVAKGAWLAPSNFHASRDAESKTYRYVIHNSKRPTALRRNLTHWVRRPINLELLNEYSKIIEGFHDFKSFQNSGGSTKTSAREILSAKWMRPSSSTVVFEIHGKGFLKQMVRNIVGTMLELEENSAPPSEFKEILLGRDRRLAKATAPAAGLFLHRIYYPQSLDKKCRKL
jgi:tRNA pseudouridine38-40 synthase